MKKNKLILSDEEVKDLRKDLGALRYTISLWMARIDEKLEE